jgi:predicted esterase
MSDFIHVWKPCKPGSPTLLVLHGTGGNEHDLLPLAHALAPDANVLSPRGKVLEGGMPRFFRRFAEGVLDVEDLKLRAGELAAFVARASNEHGFDAARVYALGYSNGANVALGILFEHPTTLAGALLARPMLAYEPGPIRLEGKPVLVLAGERDPYTRTSAREALARALRDRHARVEIHVESAGHELGNGDVQAARVWIEKELR